MNNKLSTCIITKNEEYNIERCLRSVYDVSDEVVVVDSGSTDKTLEICKKYNCKIIETEWLGYGETKKLAVNSAENDWVLVLDADEELSERLREEIKKLFVDNAIDNYVGYKINFILVYFAKKLHFGSTRGETHIRLFNKNFVNYNSAKLHESVIINGKISKITNGYVLHYSYKNLRHHLEKLNHYTDIAAQNYLLEKKYVSFFKVLLDIPFSFFDSFILKLGFLDGLAGFSWAFFRSFYKAVKYLKYIELKKNVK